MTSASPPRKKVKLGHEAHQAECFAPGLLSAAFGEKKHQEYVASEPYKHSVFDALFEDELLKHVKDEIIGQLSFTEKETDIYKVHQTGDLASLSYLSSDDLARLPNLLKLRDALYSAPFRNLMRTVTGCGPLSGSKQDMSVNSYRKGCHLLNHDDVIGTRRVSYILYMPIGDATGSWKSEWGGALELYPVRRIVDENGAETTGLEPEALPSKIIPPSWNQFIFFEVQPGHSFHSVEEVVVGTSSVEDPRERLSISGWFHAAQPGEEGYDPSDPTSQPLQAHSSLGQLSSAASQAALTPYPDISTTSLSSDLTADDLKDLEPFLNPSYLTPTTIRALASKFAAESSLELHAFLRGDLASSLRSALLETDALDSFESSSRKGLIPPHALSNPDWEIQGPPHKSRYCVLSSSASSSSAKPSSILSDLQTKLFPSPGFRSFLRLVSTFLPVKHNVEARRFRPGLDYTLARSCDEEVRMDVVLGLTPSKGSDSDEWEGEWGGWECYMAPHTGEDDPAVYRSGNSAKSKAKPSDENADGANGDAKMDDENEEEDNDDDDDDGTLLTVHPSFNRLLLVLRDEGVLRFVKYVSAAAPGSRWDVCGEFAVGSIEEDADADAAT